MTTHLSLTPAFMEAATSSSSSPPLPLLPFSSHSDSAHLSPFQNLKPSILVIVLILFITFLLSLSLCLLLRHLNRRCLRHLSPSSHVSSTTSSSSNRQTAARSRVSPENPELFSLIDSFPMFTYASIKRRSTNSSGDCAVCLSKFELQDQLRLLPLCCHAFHVTCIDTWLESNQTCPLCRSHIHASESEVLKALSSTIDSGGTDSFRLEIGSISHRQMASEVGLERRNSYSVGSFEYVVDEESEITMNRTHRRSISDKEIEAQVSQSTQESTLASEVGAGRSWLKDYVDRLSASLSSRALSFRSSGRFFTGSSRRTEIGSIGDYDVEANRMGDEISEMFRWFAGA